MKRSAVYLLCIAILAGSLAGCGTLKGDEKGATVSVYLASFPQTLDPSVVQLNSDVSDLLSLLYIPLTTVDSGGKVRGALAKSWYSYYDKRDEVYKMFFKLNETCWSDGVMIQPKDVIYAWKRILSPKTESPYASLLFPIKNARQVKSGEASPDSLGIAASGDLELMITFEQEFDIELFAAIVSNIHLAPLREDAVLKGLKEAEPAKKDWAASMSNMVNSGPFKVLTMETGKRLVLERNTYYFRDNDQRLDKYVIPYRIVCIFAEAESGSFDSPMTQIEYQMKRYEEGNIFYTTAFDKESYENNAKNIKTVQTLNSYVYYFNTQNEILKDARVRRALSAALDRTEIVKNITGTGEVAATGYVPSGVFDVSSKSDFRKTGGELNSAAADPDKARELLNEAGVKGGSFTITYLIPENPDIIEEFSGSVIYSNVYKDIAEYAAGVWNGLGFSVSVEGKNSAEYLAALYNREYDVLGINNIMDSVDAFGYLAPFAKYYSGTVVPFDEDVAAFTPHYTNIENAAYDALIDSVVYVSDKTERANILHQAEKMFAELCPATALFYHSANYLEAKGLKGVKIDYAGMKNWNKVKLSNYRKINQREQEASDAALLS